MRIKISRSTFAIILISELVGLFGLIGTFYSLIKFSSTYKNDITYAVQIKEDAKELQILLNQYRSQMENYLRLSQKSERSVKKSDIGLTEVQLRKEVMKHGELTRKILKRKTLKEREEIYKLYNRANDDTLVYLKYNQLLISLREKDEAPEVYYGYYDSVVEGSLKTAYADIEAMINLSNAVYKNASEKIDNIVKGSHIIAGVAIVFLVVAMVISLTNSYKVLHTLENKNAYSEKRILEIQDKTIIGIADLIENRSEETGQHVKRTSFYVNMILRQAQKEGYWPDIISEEYINLATRAAPLHDIGKIVITDAILTKPGPLLIQEFEMMKTHAAVGKKIIDKLLTDIEDPKYIRIAGNIANYHHERWDGKGYPEGLEKDNIPLSARVMAVADVFDALISKRCYKKPMPIDEAFEEIQRESGLHFDPEVVELFNHLREEIKNVEAKTSEENEE